MSDAGCFATFQKKNRFMKSDKKNLASGGGRAETNDNYYNKETD